METRERNYTVEATDWRKEVLKTCNRELTGAKYDQVTDAWRETSDLVISIEGRKLYHGV